MPASNFSFLDDLIQEVGRVKAAGTKSAKALSEAGGYAGASTHPSADADDNLITAREGFRSSENSTDVKNNREAPTVDATSDAPQGGGDGTPEQDKRQLNIGTSQSSTGQDSAVEDDYKGNKDDPGTSSVMKADDGEKYAAYKAMPFDKLAQLTIGTGNALLADIANLHTDKSAGVSVVDGTHGVTRPAGQPAATATAGVSVKAAQEAIAEDARVLVEGTIKEADTAALLVVEYLADCEKAAAEHDAAMDGEDHSGKGDAASGSGDAASAGGAPGGGNSGGGDAGGMGEPLGGGAPPPPGGGGGMPPGLDGAIAGQPDPGMQASPEEALHELAAALMEMGVDPQQLADIAKQMGGGAGGAGGGMPPGGGMGGPPPPGGGMPPPPGGAEAPPDDPMMAKAANLRKVANAVAQYKKSGRFGFGPPATTKAAALRGKMREYVAEALQLAR